MNLTLDVHFVARGAAAASGDGDIAPTAARGACKTATATASTPARAAAAKPGQAQPARAALLLLLLRRPFSGTQVPVEEPLLVLPPMHGTDRRPDILPAPPPLTLVEVGCRCCQPLSLPQMLHTTAVVMASASECMHTAAPVTWVAGAAALCPLSVKRLRLGLGQAVQRLARLLHPCSVCGPHGGAPLQCGAPFVCCLLLLLPTTATDAQMMLPGRQDQHSPGSLMQVAGRRPRAQEGIRSWVAAAGQQPLEAAGQPAVLRLPAGLDETHKLLYAILITRLVADAVGGLDRLHIAILRHLLNLHRLHVQILGCDVPDELTRTSKPMHVAPPVETLTRNIGFRCL